MSALFASVAFAESLLDETQKKAFKGDAVAQHRLGKMYYDGDGVPRNYAEAVYWWRKAAEQSDADAQFNLGLVYAIGYGGEPKSSATAVTWYSKAADQGHANAQFNLGFMYSIGEGVPKDSAEAVKWYRKAAEQGDAAAQLFLGLMYYNGDGVLKDRVQAHMWFNIAGANGNERAKENLAIVEKEMTDTQKEKAMDLARELFAKIPKKK